VTLLKQIYTEFIAEQIHSLCLSLKMDMCFNKKKNYPVIFTAMASKVGHCYHSYSSAIVC